MSVFCLALGIATYTRAGQIIEACFPQPLLHPDATWVQALATTLDLDPNQPVTLLNAGLLQRLLPSCAAAELSISASLIQQALQQQRDLILVILEQDSAPRCTAEGYLKLQLISQRLLKPHHCVLDGLFALLPNLAWTNQGPIDLDDLPMRQMQARIQGTPLHIRSVDKFPQMTDYVVPKGVRIADTARVRLGAYLGEGTTVMHEGFINFNAGTLGASMVEGRISAGVTVGAGSDLGGGCSTMGTLSGGGQWVIAIGEHCLIGANAGTGIPLGDRCTIEAGLYLTAGTKVTLIDTQGTRQVKARELAGQHDLLFRRNSVTGAVEGLSRASTVRLNAELHSHN